jgi:hypothetical protein
MSREPPTNLDAPASQEDSLRSPEKTFSSFEDGTELDVDIIESRIKDFFDFHQMNIDSINEYLASKSFGLRLIKIMLDRGWEDLKNKSLFQKGVDSFFDGIPNISVKFLFKNKYRLIISENYANLAESYRKIFRLIGPKIGLAGNTVRQRLIDLEEFAKNSNGEGVATFAMSLFPELKELAAAEDNSLSRVNLKEGARGDLLSADNSLFSQRLERAPLSWNESRLPAETPPNFIRRVYDNWLGKGLDRAHIRSLDPSLSQALDNWLRKNPMPEDIDLPTRKQNNDRRLASIESGDIPLSTLAEVSGRDGIREAQRLASALQYRQKKPAPTR